MSKRAPKLIFTEEEQLNPAVKKAEKASAKLDKAEAKIPKKKEIVKERTVDPTTGKVTVRLHFEETEKKPPSKLSHVGKDMPVAALSTAFHREMRDSDDNTSSDVVETAASTSETTFYAAQSARYSRQMKPYRTAARAEAKADRANRNALEKEIRQEYPTSNPYSKYQQKKAIKQEYLNAKRGSGNTAQASEITVKAAHKAVEQTKKAGEFIAKHKKGLLVLGGIAALLLVLLNLISSCSILVEGVLGSFGMSTFRSSETDIVEVEEAYLSMEEELRDELDYYEFYHPGYDEYEVEGEVLGHGPYVLTAILSAMYGEYELSGVEATLERIFSLQYQVTERTRLVRRGREYATICTVTLECTALEDLAEDLLTEEQMTLYEIYMATAGNSRSYSHEKEDL